MNIMRVLVAFLAACAAQASASPLMRFEGRVLDSGDRPLNGTCLLEFRIWDASSGGNEIWNESRYVAVREGSFVTDLGRLRPLPEKLLNTVHRVAVHAPAGTGWKASMAVARLSLDPAAAQAAARMPSSVPAVEAAPIPAAVAAVVPQASARSEDQSAPVSIFSATGRAMRAPAAPGEQVQRLERELEKFKVAAERSQKGAERAQKRLDSLEHAVRVRALPFTGSRIYEAQEGDTLRSIAQKVYGSPERWADIYEANRDRLQRGGDPVSGQKIVIPRDGKSLEGL